MNQAEFEVLLKQSLQSFPQRESGLEDTLRLARAQASQKAKRKRIPFRRFLFQQIGYIGWKLWALQFLMLAALHWQLTVFYDPCFWTSPANIARLLFCVSTLVAMMSLPLLYRSRRYRMQETESVSYFSSRKLLMAKLTAIGIGDVCMLCGLFLMTVVRTSMRAGSLALCLLLPFLIISAAYLYMMGHCSGNGFFIGSLSLGTAMLLLAVTLPGQWLPLFQQGLTVGWCLPCLGLLAFSAEQLRYLLCRSPYAELQLL